MIDFYLQIVVLFNVVNQSSVYAVFCDSRWHIL